MLFRMTIIINEENYFTTQHLYSSLRYGFSQTTAEFSLFPILCCDFDLPLVSDNGMSGTWAPGYDLDQFAGQTLDFTFTNTVD